MADKEVADGIASDLPENVDKKVPPQSVEEIKGELRHEIDNVVTVTEKAMRDMGQQFHEGLTELHALVADLRRAQGMKTEPLIQRNDVPDAPNRRTRKPEPESEPGEEEEKQPEPEGTDNEAEIEEKGESVSFA